MKSDTEAERRLIADTVFASLRLAGLEPDELGKTMMERVVQGEITAREAIAYMKQHYHTAHD